MSNRRGDFLDAAYLMELLKMLRFHLLIMTLALQFLRLKWLQGIFFSSV
jgi:hypothetical protein